MHTRAVVQMIMLLSSELLSEAAGRLENDATKIISNKLDFRKAKSQIVQDNLPSCL